MILQGLFDVIQDACPMSIGSCEPGDVRILGSMDADVLPAAQGRWMPMFYRQHKSMMPFLMSAAKGDALDTMWSPA